MIRWLAILVVVLCAAALVSGCKSKSSSQSQAVALTKEAPENVAGGIVWSYPSRWTKAGPKPMRVVTYTVAPAQGDTESAECAVSFFGSGSGGDVDMNIQRWSGQFENAPPPVRKDEVVDGMNVAKVEISGNYLAPAGPMMEPSGTKSNFKMLGAIVEAPEGKMFLKLIGPAKTVQGASAEFDALIGSIAKK